MVVGLCIHLYMSARLCLDDFSQFVCLSHSRSLFLSNWMMSSSKRINVACSYRVSAFLGVHVDKSEAARAASFTILHNDDVEDVSKLRRGNSRGKTKRKWHTSRTPRLDRHTNQRWVALPMQSARRDRPAETASQTVRCGGSSGGVPWFAKTDFQRTA